MNEAEGVFIAVLPAEYGQDSLKNINETEGVFFYSEIVIRNH